MDMGIEPKPKKLTHQSIQFKMGQTGGKVVLFVQLHAIFGWIISKEVRIYTTLHKIETSFIGLNFCPVKLCFCMRKTNEKEERKKRRRKTQIYACE